MLFVLMSMAVVDVGMGRAVGGFEDIIAGR